MGKEQKKQTKKQKEQAAKRRAKAEENAKNKPSEQGAGAAVGSGIADAHHQTATRSAAQARFFMPAAVRASPPEDADVNPRVAAAGPPK